MSTMPASIFTGWAIVTEKIIATLRPLQSTDDCNLIMSYSVSCNYMIMIIKFIYYGKLEYFIVVMK